MPNDTVEFRADLEFTALRLYDFTINNNAGDQLKIADADLPKQDVINKVFLEVDGVQKEAVIEKTPVKVDNVHSIQNKYVVDITQFKDINPDSKINLKIQYLNGYEFTSELFVEKDKNQRTVDLAMNQIDYTNPRHLDNLARALGVDVKDLSVSPSRVSPGTQDYTVMNKGEKLFTYRQTYSDMKDPLAPSNHGSGSSRFEIPYGRNSSQSNTSDVEVRIYETLKNGSTNFSTDRLTFKSHGARKFELIFLPSVGVFYGNNVDNETERNYTLIGDYYVTFSKDGKETRYRFASPMAEAKVSPLQDGKFDISGAVGGGRIVPIVNGKDGIPNEEPNVKKKYISINLCSKDNLKHGFNVFNVKFNVDESSIKRDINRIKNEGKVDKVQIYDVPAKRFDNNVESTLIVVFDKYDAAATQISFKVTDSKKGQLTFKNGKDKLGSVSPALDINGAKITKTEDKGNDVIFDVEFLEEIPVSFEYELRGNSKTIEGKVDTGRVEAVNVTIGETDNTGLENVDKFRVNAKLTNSGEGKAMINSFLTDIIDYKELYKEANSFGVSVGSGKYQGIYKAGFILQKSKMGIQIKKHESTLPNNISLLLDASYFGQSDDFKSNVIGVLEYKKSDSTDWQKLSDIAQDIVKNEEEVLLKVTDAKLELGKSYDFRVKYVYTNPEDKNDTNVTYSNVVTQVISDSNVKMEIQIKKHESTSPNTISLLLDSSYFGQGDDFKSNVTGILEYKKSDSTDWQKLSDIAQDIVKNEEEVLLKVTDAKLESGKSCDFRIKYVYTNPNDKNDTLVVKSDVVTQIIYSNHDSNNNPSVGNGTISGNGGGSSVTTGSGVGSTTINTTTSNTIEGNTDVLVTLPSGVRYDNGRTPMPINFKYKGKDGKVVTEKRDEYSNVKASFDGDKIKVEGLVPGKDYTELYIDYTDNNGKTRTLILKNVRVDSNVDSENYLANVYMVVLNRPADENGYHFHLGNLKGKKVSVREFLLNMLTEKEFVETYTTTESKIEALYSGIVARESDEQGKAFWVNEYKKMLSVYGSESATLKAIADRMVHENELKELADKMGFLY